MNEMAIDEIAVLEPGDCIMVRFGFEHMLMYVQDRTDKGVKLNSFSWTNESGIWHSWKSIRNMRAYYVTKAKPHNAILRVLLLPLIKIGLVHEYSRPRHCNHVIEEIISKTLTYR